ncbi:hypothetical protein EV182_005103, partial [Spiromyces aspiralis]
AESKDKIQVLEADLSKEQEAHREVKSMLEEYVDTSTKFIEEKERESDGLSKELAKLTLARQSLESTLTETTELLERAIGERDAEKSRAESLENELRQVEAVNQALRHDIQVAQERCDRIQQYAQETLDQANCEIEQLRHTQAKSTKDLALLRAQLGKTESKLRSTENELNSTRMHNHELFSLCESLERELRR